MEGSQIPFARWVFDGEFVDFFVGADFAGGSHAFGDGLDDGHVQAVDGGAEFIEFALLTDVRHGTV